MTKLSCLFFVTIALVEGNIIVFIFDSLITKSLIFKKFGYFLIFVRCPSF